MLILRRVLTQLLFGFLVLGGIAFSMSFDFHTPAMLFISAICIATMVMWIIGRLLFLMGFYRLPGPKHSVASWLMPYAVTSILAVTLFIGLWCSSMCHCNGDSHRMWIDCPLQTLGIRR